jgi:hypothetical protein
MRKLRAWGLAATLVAILSTATAKGADDESESTKKPASGSSGSMWNPMNWFRSKDKQATETKKTPTKSDKETVKKPAAPKRINEVDQAAAERSREEAALFRRLAVCDKLMEIAVRNNDNELLRRAETLDERARAAYAQRTAHLGNVGEFQSDEQILEKHLGAKTAKKTDDKEPHSVAGNDKDSRAAKEVNP